MLVIKSPESESEIIFSRLKIEFKLSLKYFQKIIKQLLNSVLAGHEELLRPALTISHTLLDLIQ